MSQNESISNKVGNATGGAVGEQTLVNHAVEVAKDFVDYGKGAFSAFLLLSSPCVLFSNE